MKVQNQYSKLLPIYAGILCLLLLAGFGWSRGVTVFNEITPVNQNHCVILDAGHGGVDGGATSCTGLLESNINLEITKRLDDLLHLLGIETRMIRDSDISVYTEGESIAAKKVSDLKKRVQIVNETENAVLVSIHQNHFTDKRYSGAQVFYAKTEESDLLARQMQSLFVDALNPGSKRKAKKSDGVYLMDKINCTGVLIECGFLSNPEEEALLSSPAYQKKVSCVIASGLSIYLFGSSTP